MAQARGKLILVSGPSGSGKGELVRFAFSRFPELHFLVSATTRAMRPGEAEGREYHFLSREEFEKRRDAGGFIEWAAYGGNYYGTPKEALEWALASGEVVLHELDVQGARQLKAIVPSEDLTLVFIDAGPWEELQERIRARAPIGEEELQKRAARYADEMTFRTQADLVISNRNGELEDAKEAFATVLASILAETGKVS